MSETNWLVEIVKKKEGFCEDMLIIEVDGSLILGMRKATDKKLWTYFDDERMLELYNASKEVLKKKGLINE